MRTFSVAGSPSGRLGRAIARQMPLFGDGKPVFYWAENGLVKYSDERPNCPEHKRYGTMSWQEAARRTLAVSQMVINSAEDPRWGKERMTLQEFVCDMERVIAEAKSQGGPDDVIRTGRMTRKPTRTVIVPSLVGID